MSAACAIPIIATIAPAASVRKLDFIIQLSKMHKKWLALTPLIVCGVPATLWQIRVPLEPIGAHLSVASCMTQKTSVTSPLIIKAISEMGPVSRVTPVHTALRNCTRDEGRSFEVGNQVLISNHRKLLWSKAMVVNVAEKLERDSGRYDWERRAQANRFRSVEMRLDDAKTGG